MFKKDFISVDTNDGAFQNVDLTKKHDLTLKNSQLLTGAFETQQQQQHNDSCKSRLSQKPQLHKLARHETVRFRTASPRGEIESLGHTDAVHIFTFFFVFKCSLKRMS